MPLDEAIAAALANRPELAATAASESINQTDVRYLENQTKPQVNLVASYTSSGLSGRAVPQAPIVFPGGGALSSSPPAELIGGYGQSLSNLLNQLFPTTQLRVDVAVPLGNHAAKANLASALVQGRQIELQREEVEQTITAAVRDAMQAVASAQARVAAASDAVRWAEQVYASEQRKFQAGTTTVFLLFQRQTTMINARTQLARAQADLSIAISQFAAATGTTLRARNINLQP
jgi:HAE1 family hydrophobic/amphiphilic exporter-1